MEIKFFKIKKNFKKRKFQINSDYYWKIVLLATFILILASFAFGFYFFIKINKDVILPDDQKSQARSVGKERVDKVLNYFTEREIKSQKILNSPSPVVDPSL